MSFRLGAIASLAHRSLLLRHQFALQPTLRNVIINQLRKVSSTAVVREQYLQGYKDNERYHGKRKHTRLKSLK